MKLRKGHLRPRGYVPPKKAKKPSPPKAKKQSPARRPRRRPYGVITYLKRYYHISETKARNMYDNMSAEEQRGCELDYWYHKEQAELRKNMPRGGKGLMAYAHRPRR